MRKCYSKTRGGGILSVLAYSKQNYFLNIAIVLVHHRMTINFPDMTEELLTRTPNYKTNKQNES